MSQEQITFEEAKALVLERLKEDEIAAWKWRPEEEKDQLVIHSFEEFELGWIFFYDSKKHHETGDFQYQLVGNAPFIVCKEDGKLYITGTARPSKFYLDEFRKGNRTLAYDSNGKRVT